MLASNAALADYDVKGEATVRFGVGSSKLEAKAQDALKQLADSAADIKGYIIEVTGYADSTGYAAMNTTLSEERAKEVVTYLIQPCGVTLRHIIAPAAVGESGPQHRTRPRREVRKTVGSRSRFLLTSASPAARDLRPHDGCTTLVYD